MKNIYIVFEALTNGYMPVSLDILFLLSILSGIFVIITKNPVTSVVFLISLFVNVACYLVLIGIHFVGISYLLVYIGAVTMLLLFTIMLINIRTADLYSNVSKVIPLGIMVSIAFYLPVYYVISSFNPNLNSDLGVQFATSNK